jgi:hypothetical protein
MRLACLLCVALLLAGCPDDGGNGSPSQPTFPRVALAELIGPSGGTADADGGTAVSIILSGSVSFDRLPVTAAGLSDTPSVEAAAFVTIEVVEHDSLAALIATATTDASGDYSLNFDTDKDFYVRARSESGDDRVFHPRAQTVTLHAVSTPILNRAMPVQVANLHADFSLPHNRAGAFAALDTVRRLRESVTGSFPTLGALDVFWCIGNHRPQGALPDQGMIAGTDSTLNGPNARPAVFLVGGTAADPLNTDHDEFDESVIAHEWAHFLQQSVSRDNNFGGPHAGEEMLYTAAYSEGLVTALGCALLGVDVYRDTVGYPGGATAMQFEFHLESGLVPGSGLGYGNEFRVARMVWDILDGGAGWPPDADGDPIAVDKSDFFASFAALATRGAPYEVAWMASLLQQLIDDGHVAAADAHTLVAAHGEAFPPVGAFDPFPELLILGAAPVAGQLNAWAGADPNPILGPQANAVYRIELAATQSLSITVTNTSAGFSPQRHRLILSLHDLEREILAHDDSRAAILSITESIGPGTYILRVQHVPDSEAASAETTFMLGAQ